MQNFQKAMKIHSGEKNSSVWLTKLLIFMSNEPNSKANKNILSRLNEVKRNTSFIPTHQSHFQCWGNYYYHNYDFDHYGLESMHVFMAIFDLWTLGKVFINTSEIRSIKNQNYLKNCMGTQRLLCFIVFLPNSLWLGFHAVPKRCKIQNITRKKMSSKATNTL